MNIPKGYGNFRNEIGFKIDINMNSVFYGIFKSNSQKEQDFFSGSSYAL